MTNQTPTTTSNNSTTSQLLHKRQPTLPFKRLSFIELQDRQDKGICYACDEKYVPSHKCKGGYYMLIHQEDDLPSSSLPLSNPLPFETDFQHLDSPPKVDIQSTIPENPHISLHALLVFQIYKLYVLTTLF